MKILIVDDQFVSRQKAQKILSQYGECDSAVNGNEAYQAYILAREDGCPYDLIVMDINLPDDNGIEVLKKIRAWEKSSSIPYEKSVKALVVTATDDANILPSFSAGCQGYIVKPFTREKLMEAINDSDSDLKDLFRDYLI